MRNRIAIGGLVLAAAMPWGAREARAGDDATTAEIADLVDELRDPDAHVREVARKRLVALGDAAVPALVELLRRDDVRGRIEAATTLGAIGPGAKKAAPAIAERARDATGRARLSFVQALAQIDPVGGASIGVPMLLGFLEDADPSLRLEAAKALREFGPGGRDYAADVLAKIPSSGASVRGALLEALRAMGVDAARTVVDLYAERGENDRAWIAAVVAELGESIVPVAVDRLGAEDKAMRAGAAQILGVAGVSAKGATPQLVAALQDSAGVVRRRAAEALGLVGADPKVALPALAAVVRDPASRAQLEAITAIGRVAAGVRVESQTAVFADATPAIAGGLDWLARHQAPDGRWDAAGFGSLCKDGPCADPGENGYAPGVTGLALQAFLGAGETHQSGSYRDAVKNGLKVLRDLQDSDGCIGPRTSQHFLYNHGAAALAMTEAYRRTQSRVFKDPAQRAVAFTLRAKNPYLGWRYNFPPDGDNDTSSTGWQIEVVKSAADAGLDVDRGAFKDALAWVDKMTEPEFGRVGYQQRGGPPARTQETMTRFPADKSESLTAEGLIVRLAAGRDAKNDAMLVKSADLVAARPPRWSDGSVDFYYWRFGTEAMHKLGGANWDVWRASLNAALLPSQGAAAAGCARGSWAAVDPWGPEGGRVYSTSMALLALEECGSTAAAAVVKKQQATDEVRAAVGALRVAADSEDEAVKQAAKTALAAISAVYRDETWKK